MSNVGSLTILPNGDLASGSMDKTIKIWDSNMGLLKRNLTGHTGTVFSVIVLPNGDLASGSSDKTIKIWNISN
jgi:WD40 repeat protein